MASKKAEERQQRILEFMKREIEASGVPPTIREICEELNIKSTSTVYNDIRELKENGLVKKGSSKSRAALPVSSRSSGSSSAETSLKTDSRTSVREDFDIVELPVIGRVAAGTPILAEENIEDTIAFPARFIGSGNNFILNVHGNSMINVGINDGDYLIVQEDSAARNGEIVVAQVEGEFESEMTVKTFYKENGHIRLQPENDELDPIIVDDCKIVGKVKGVFRYFN